MTTNTNTVLDNASRTAYEAGQTASFARAAADTARRAAVTTVLSFARGEGSTTDAVLAAYNEAANASDKAVRLTQEAVTAYAIYLRLAHEAVCSISLDENDEKAVAEYARVTDKATWTARAYAQHRLALTEATAAAVKARAVAENAAATAVPAAEPVAVEPVAVEPVAPVLTLINSPAEVYSYAALAASLGGRRRK